jgi:hypothetical protein
LDTEEQREKEQMMPTQVASSPLKKYEAIHYKDVMKQDEEPPQ